MNDWKTIARQLMAHDFVIADVKYGSLKITPKGRTLLRGEATFCFRPDVLQKKKAGAAFRKPATRIADDIPDGTKELFHALIGVRARPSAA